MGWSTRKTHPKNPKKWVELDNWVSMVSKMKKHIKNNGFWVKPYPNPITLLPNYTNMHFYFYFYFHWEEGEYKRFCS